MLIKYYLQLKKYICNSRNNNLYNFLKGIPFNSKIIGYLYAK